MGPAGHRAAAEAPPQRAGRRRRARRRRARPAPPARPAPQRVHADLAVPPYAPRAADAPPSDPARSDRRPAAAAGRVPHRAPTLPRLHRARPVATPPTHRRRRGHRRRARTVQAAGAAALVCEVDRDVRGLLSPRRDDRLRGRRRPPAPLSPTTSSSPPATPWPTAPRRPHHARGRHVADALPSGSQATADAPARRLQDLHLRGLLALLGDDERIRLFVERELAPLRSPDGQAGARTSSPRCALSCCTLRASRTRPRASTCPGPRSTTGSRGSRRSSASTSTTPTPGCRCTSRSSPTRCRGSAPSDPDQAREPGHESNPSPRRRGCGGTGCAGPRGGRRGRATSG